MKEEKIIILNIFSGVGGGISTWIRKSAAYSGENYEIDAMAFSITNKANFIDVIDGNGGKCYEMPRLKSGVLKFLRNTEKKIKSIDPDVIHCHIDGYAALPFWFISRFLVRKPIIIHSHRTAIEKVAGTSRAKYYYAFNRFINSIIGKNCVACGKKAANFAFGEHNHAKIFYNGIEPVKTDIKTGPVMDPLVLLSLGRLNTVKNHDYIIKICKVLKENNVSFEMYIVGDGELKDTIYDSINEFGLSDKVFLTGYCNTPEDYLSKADILLLPSFSEGLPTVMIEAQKFGCRVIANDIITHECDLDLGLVRYLGIRSEDIQQWSDTIQLLGKKSSMSSDLINNALADKGFINSVIYEDYFTYVNDLAKKGK